MYLPPAVPGLFHNHPYSVLTLVNCPCFYNVLPHHRADGRGVFFYMPRIRGFNGGATGEAAVPTERGPVSTWSWFSMPHTDCGAKYCNQFKGDVSVPRGGEDRG